MKLHGRDSALKSRSGKRLRAFSALELAVAVALFAGTAASLLTAVASSRASSFISSARHQLVQTLSETAHTVARQPVDTLVNNTFNVPDPCPSNPATSCVVIGGTTHVITYSTSITAGAVPTVAVTASATAIDGVQYERTATAGAFTPVNDNATEFNVTVAGASSHVGRVLLVSNTGTVEGVAFTNFGPTATRTQVPAGSCDATNPCTATFSLPSNTSPSVTSTSTTSNAIVGTSSHVTPVIVEAQTEVAPADDVTLNVPTDIAQGEDFVITATVVAASTPMEGRVVAFASQVNGVTVDAVNFSPAFCITNASGVCQVNASPSATTQTGSVTVLAVSDNSTSAMSELLQITPGPVWFTTPHTETTAGETIDLTVTINDGDGNPVPDNTEVTFTTDSITSDPELTVSGTVEFELTVPTDTPAGEFTFTVTADETERQLSVLVINPPTTITATTPAVNADGLIEFTATVTDSTGTPLPDVTVGVSTVDDVLVQEAVVTDEAGTAQIRMFPTVNSPTTFDVFLIAGTTSETVTVQQ